ncbi:DUF5906 domain-containing protein [Laspinema olomoucense]|uniref:DUF5906 domain-containing protein n=1 Tax=Laspinema olomoucense TaxID=3231600 RepID=UPI0021BB1978|nr:DUF5906 domain-containing protein [Laspinema sp. D3c]MCT7993782.1 helicase superfamily 3 [Laspinema sp. D3c]
MFNSTRDASISAEFLSASVKVASGSPFNMLNWVETLEPVAGKKNRYICPVCQGNNLTVDPQSGAYQCWNGCECKDIRATLGDRPTSISPGSTRQKTAQKSFKPALFPEGQPVLARLRQPGIPPKSQKLSFQPKGVPNHAVEIRYHYSETQVVYRFEWLDPKQRKGHKKTFRQCHLNEDGLPIWSKGNDPWKAYRETEALAASARVVEGFPVLLLLEGEGCVEIARTLGLAAVTFQGSAWTDVEIESFLIRLRHANENATIAVLPDRDETGRKKAAKVAAAAAKVGVPCLELDPTQIDPELPEKGDIREMLENSAIPSDLIQRLEGVIRQGTQRNSQTLETESYDSFFPVVEFNQAIVKFLYGDRPWICVNNTLYAWQGTYYEASPNAVELYRITQFCNSFPIDVKGQIRYPYASSSSVKKALEWVKLMFAIAPGRVNPPGLNCTNGVLQLSFTRKGQPSWKLVPHDPRQHFYLYQPLVTYDPEADPTDCDRLLECLEPQYRDIFLKTIAASLDLESVRRLKGRMVKALLAKGDGNNGKDSLREVTAMLYGYQGLTSVSVEAFEQADRGRLFPVARLEGSRVNWPSENRNAEALDRLQCLKIAITGDRSFVIERKGKDDYETAINAVFIFNWNDIPELAGVMEAIRSRYAVLPFTKTFAVKPNPRRGELPADPRFKYDPEFLKSKVLPAYLNRLLDALQRLMRDGIDYSPTQEAMTQIQCASEHLWQFVKDSGLVEDPDSRVYVQEIWQKLRQWYQDTGILQVESSDRSREKLLWYDLPSASDRHCKTLNQVPVRLLSMFPKAKKGGDEQGTFLRGLKWHNPQF